MIVTADGLFIAYYIFSAIYMIGALVDKDNDFVPNMILIILSPILFPFILGMTTTFEK